MITNERQYRITRTQLEKFKEAIASYSIKEVTERLNSKKLAKAEFDALQSEFENLCMQIQEYETLKTGSIEILKAATLEQLPSILIRARIARNLSQRELAEKIGTKEQQIQRYEAEEYASANLKRLVQIAMVLEINISEIAEFMTSQKTIDIREDDLAWIEFPIKEMYKRNWLEGFFSGSLSTAIDNAEELVKEFITGALAQPVRTAARQRIRLGGIVNMYALLAWQCRVIYLAQKKETQNKFKNRNITNEWLSQLLELSCQNDGPQKAVEYLLECGIHLVIVPHLTHTHLDGAALLLKDGPVIGLTLRYDRIDNFWFVLLHELIHIKKHLQIGKVETIFDDLDEDANDIEIEADHDAGEIMISSSKWETALARYVRSKKTIIDLAMELKINPSIIAGKIRREANNYTILTDMVGQGEVRKLFPDIDFSY